MSFGPKPEDFRGWVVVPPEDADADDYFDRVWFEAHYYSGSGDYASGGFKPIPSLRFVAKWDGCCHLHFATEGNDPDYLHLCNGPAGFDEIIARLTEFRDSATEHFRKHGQVYWGNK